MLTTTKTPSAWKGLGLEFTGQTDLDGEPDSVSAIRYTLEALGSKAPISVLRAALVRDGMDFAYVDDAIMDAILADPPAFHLYKVGH